MPERREEPAEPEHGAHRRGALEQLALLRREGRDARLHRVLDRDRQADAREALDVNLPVLVLGELVLDLEHAHVVEDADHLLEQRGVSARERARRVDEILDGLVLAARREEILHHRGRVGVGERRELDELVTIAAELRPAVVTHAQLRAREAEDQDRRREVLDEVAEEVERLFVRVLEIVEHEHDRPARDRVRLRRRRERRGRSRGLGDVRRVGLEESLDDRAAQMPDLLRVALHRLDERRVEELEVEQLPEEVDDVADLAILEDRGGLRAHLRLRRLGVEPFDDAEARAKDATEDAVRRTLIARRAAEDARPRLRPLRANANEEIAHEARLSDPGGAEQGHRAAHATLRNVVQRLLELAHLGHSPDEHRASFGDAETGGGHEAHAVGHHRQHTAVGERKWHARCSNVLP